MTEEQETTPEPSFNRTERLRIAALEARLAHLVDGDSHSERRGDPAYPPGEAKAIVWALSVLRKQDEPLERRVDRIDASLRRLYSKVGRIEHDYFEED